jgi:hypothetical protein
MPARQPGSAPFLTWRLVASLGREPGSAGSHYRTTPESSSYLSQTRLVNRNVLPTFLPSPFIKTEARP